MRFRGNWLDDHQEIEISVPMILFEEDNCQILYCPALDISGYGKNEDEAYESFKISLGEFFKYTTNKGTFNSELLRMGWELKKKGKPMIPPTMQQLLEENENFSRIFNNFSFKKFDQPVAFPNCA
jgi:hypothetical protein